ncbi:AAA family ATPase [Legionella pneumophila]|nr:AAA family ATPase [Legionella pneumophila]MDW8925296.1 AAA family ATPase [Legionella pneumophila]MDW8931246.1 AAA family ATPase [Legionella pneumophila]MDW8933988.1 AAA family ATPase [Legionella pneumophila]MDW8971795.1 AAA family ATPase [Legionella pneumophila]
MRISFIEVQNFRKLKSIRIDLSKNRTLFVGANNSGKTTAMIALRRFLVDQKFNAYDFTLSNWTQINKIGANWEKADIPPLDLAEWEGTLPLMDVWLDVEPNEIHYVQHLLPTLDWTGGLLGVRLRLEPKKLEELHNEYIVARHHAISTINSAKQNKDRDYKVSLWPSCMKDFLERSLSSRFRVHSYILDPNKLVAPKNGSAQPQLLSPTAEYMEENPFAGLIRIDEINAQRGFSDAHSNGNSFSERGEENIGRGDTRKLSNQLRSYYDKHLDPSEIPESGDVDALEAIHEAQEIFDKKLATSFSEVLKEVQNLGYPGINDPTLTISTRIKPIDGLNHPSALQYEVISSYEDEQGIPPRLPEQYNGLGYQNLISMVFRLMSFRNEWMQVGKIGKKAINKSSETAFPPPLHLVLVEEPEAHLHVQVQQVFIRRAYEILRNHQDLKENKTLTTQLVVSTHSSHITHECEFECLRYFRRKPASNPGDVPTSSIINLSEVFGKHDETAKFVTRYLKSAHCDLFFADAAIFIEGAAERMMIPHFIRENFPILNQRYLTLMEIGGSHAHCFQPLIEHLGLTTLIISDIDAAENKGRKHSQPIVKGGNQVTRNTTLRTWIPGKESIDDLLDLAPSDKIKIYSEANFLIRVAYQLPLKITLDSTVGEINIAANTFEDALVYENIDLFKTLEGNGLVKKFNEALNQNKTPAGLTTAMFEALKSGSKAEFALDLLFLKDPKVFNVPTYIREGLEWLQEQVCNKKEVVSENISLSSSDQGEVAQ